MLETLRITQYALIDSLEIEFHAGFNALTGETGAGKSILVGALNLVLGARASSEQVRQGTKKASVEAAFRIAKPSRRLAALLKEHDVEIEEGTLLLARTVTSEGRSKAYAGGSLVPVSVLAAIGDELVDLHGQHEHQSLLKQDRQVDLLDGFAGCAEEAAKIGDFMRELRAQEREIAELQAHDRERERRIEFLRFEVEEIDKADLAPGEEEEVRTRRNLIANAEEVVRAASQAFSALYESEGEAALDMLDTALSAMEELAEVDERFKVLADRLRSLRAETDDIAQEIRGMTEAVEFDPVELDRLNGRLALISELKRKFGDSIEAILSYRDRAAEELARYDQRDERLEALQKEHDRTRDAAEGAAAVLSKRRATASRKLDKAVTANLQELGMRGGSFQTRLTHCELGTHGVDDVEFLLSANPGEQPKPLRQVASGGEISRVMLALKSVFANADSIPALVFDEIDAGVGGAVAGKVASKMRDLSESHQVLCVTHLPQIAAVADAHFHVSKAEKGTRTVTAVHQVEADRRVEELARLLDGSVSEVSLEHARVLLDKAG